MKTLFWFSNHPNIYNDYLFRKIAEANFVDLQVRFIKNVKTTHPWKSKLGIGFNYKIINQNLRIDWSEIKAVFSRPENSIYLLAGWNNPTSFILLTILSILGKPFYIWTDTLNLDKSRTGLKSLLREKWLSFILRKCTFFLTTGEVGVKKAKMIPWLNHKKIINFPFATDIDFFSVNNRKENTQKIDSIVFIASGRIDFNHKGQDLMIEAFSKVRDQGYEGFLLKIAGTGPQTQKLKSLISQRNLDDFVELLGWQEPNDLPKLYNSGDVFIHTSHFDPFPNSILEAMACGLAIIGSEKAGSALDRITIGKNGFIHKDNDVDDIAKYIKLFLSNEIALKEMKLESRKIAEKWSIEYNLSILKKLLKEK